MINYVNYPEMNTVFWDNTLGDAYADGKELQEFLGDHGVVLRIFPHSHIEFFNLDKNKIEKLVPFTKTVVFLQGKLIKLQKTTYLEKNFERTTICA